MAQYQQRTQPMHRSGGEAGTLSYGASSVVGAAAAPAQQPYYRIQQQHAPLFTTQPISYPRDGYRGGGEYVRSVNNRISLLTPTYLPPPAPPPPPPSSDPPPFKKIRLASAQAASNTNSTDHRTAQSPHQQLRIDTRDTKYSQAEQMSPSAITDLTIEDQSFRTTKDDLLQQISKVDREIALSENTLKVLERKAEQLEKSASKPQSSAEPEAEVPRHRSLEQSIYLENRKKAKVAHLVLEPFGLNNQWPLYNQPQDTEVYKENKVRHKTFRPKLLAYMRRMRAEKEKREEKLAEAYTQRLQEWRQRVERIEQSQKRRAKDARSREFFEKVFPELRKQREDRERFNRVGARVKSEADLEEIVDGLQEQEMEDKKMRSYAVVPPLLFETCVRATAYRDTNGRCLDMEAEHRDMKHSNVWTAHERELFKEKYLQHPKNFGAISSYLDRKTVRDCVRFYYITKKTENYKQLLKRNRARPAKRNTARTAEQLGAGVQTRQRAKTGDKEANDLQSHDRDQMGQQNDATRAAEADPPTSEMPEARSSSPSGSPAPCLALIGDGSRLSAAATPLGSAAVPTPPPAAPMSPASAPALPSPPATAMSAAPVTTASDALTETTLITVTATPEATTNTDCVFGPQKDMPQPAAQQPQPHQPLAQAQPQPMQCDMTLTAQPESLICGVCSTSVEISARMIGRARAHHYGLSEAAGVNARVCEGCHTACVRGRFARCPIVSCAGPRVRAKRLRLLPPRWHDLPHHLKQPIMEEFQVSAELSKCCLACSKRIVRRIEAIAGPALEPTEEEVTRFRTLLREHGTDWAAIAQTCSKPAPYVKAFYLTHRRRYSLDTNGIPPSHSDSSCGESGTPSPPPPPAPPPVHPSHAYDSSATETADEESETPPTPAAVSTVAPVLPVPIVTTTVAPTPHHTTLPPPPTPTATITVHQMFVKAIEDTFKANGPTMQRVITSSAAHVAPLVAPPVSSMVGRDSHVTLTVVPGGSHHTSPAPRSPQRPATITPVTTPRSDTPDKDLLDLTVRKTRVPFTPPPRPAQALAPPLSAPLPAPHPAPPISSRLYHIPPSPQPQSAPPQSHDRYYPRQQQLYPKKVPPPKGSITLGTAATHSPEPELKSTGSIIAGTPVAANDKRPPPSSYDYYKTPSPGVYSRPPSYGHEQRQIILVDYMTSQQMSGVGGGQGGGGNGSTGARGVIQRNPGGGGNCEALKSLVEVAIQQPSLPVPRQGKATPPTQQQQQQQQPSQLHAATAQEQHYQDRLNRDIAYKNYHRQLEALESHRRQMAAVNQIQAQQGREREQQQRAMAAKRIAAMEHHQIMDRHHNMQSHAQMSKANAPNSGSGGVVGGPPQSVEDPRSRFAPAQRKEQQQQQAPLPSQQQQGNIRNTTGNRAEGTLTAASLIDAIIHHQITQTPCDGPPQQTRQYTYVRDGTTAVNVSSAQQIQQQHHPPAPPTNQSSAPLTMANDVMSHEEHAAHTASIKLGDLASNIITRDFNSQSLMQIRHNDIHRRYQSENSYPPKSSGGLGNAADDWKRSRETPSSGPKHAPYLLEPVSPPDNHHPNSRPSPVSNVATSSPAGIVPRGYVPNTSSARGNIMDFVANRIVEAMRSDTKPPETTSGFTYYPYSALTVPVGDAQPPPPPTAPSSHSNHPPPPEPAPLMSAQYEPLSDED